MNKKKIMNDIIARHSLISPQQYGEYTPVQREMPTSGGSEFIEQMERKRQFTESNRHDEISRDIVSIVRMIESLSEEIHDLSERVNAVETKERKRKKRDTKTREDIKLLRKIIRQFSYLVGVSSLSCDTKTLWKDWSKFSARLSKSKDKNQTSGYIGEYYKALEEK